MFLARIRQCIGIFFRLQYLVLQQVYGAWRVSALPQPVVTIYGGHRVAPTDMYAKDAHKLAAMLVDEGISVLTGGGGGIMKAASCGALLSKKARGRVMGIGVAGLDEQRNECAHQFIRLNYLYARKWLMTRYAVAFVVFPGGFGTLDEFAEILTLIHIGKVKHLPVVLIGTDFWKEFIQWLKDQALDKKLIVPEDIAMFRITDDINEAFSLIRDSCKPMTKETK